MKQTGIYKKLNKVFIIQLVFISVVTVASVFGAAKVVEKVLIKEALIGEAKFFWKHYEKNPDFPMPKTMNLTGYLADEGDDSNLPQELRSIKENYQRVALNEKMPLVYFSEKHNKRLYLIFEEAQVSKLALYFGITPLILVLLAIYLPAFYSYMQSKKAFSPILQVIKKIESVNVNKRELEKLNFDEVSTSGNKEVIALVHSFENFSKRISDFIKRERNFSRYASHELRTPLTVLRGSIGLLKKKNPTSEQSHVIKRMEMMILDMQDLVESLLILSKEQNVEISRQTVIMNDLVKMTADNISTAYSDKKIRIQWKEIHLFESDISEQLFVIVLNNLIRNAFDYSPSNSLITITLECSVIKIKDNGAGMTKAQLDEIFKPFYRVNEHSDVKGFGLGLAIVDWVCQQCGWDVYFESEADSGTLAVLDLKSGKILSELCSNRTT